MRTFFPRRKATHTLLLLSSTLRGPWAGVGRRAVPLAGATLEPGQGLAGAQSPAVCWGHSGEDRSKIRPAVPAPSPIQTAAGCGRPSAHTAEGARWLWVPPHLRPQCKACTQHGLSQGSSPESHPGSMLPPACIWSLYWGAWAEPPRACGRGRGQARAGRVVFYGPPKHTSQKRGERRNKQWRQEIEKVASNRKGSSWSAHLLLPPAFSLLLRTHGLGGQVTLGPLLASGVPNHEHWQNPACFAG